MNVTFPDWALAKYPELATLHIGAYETVSIFIVNVLPFTSPEQKDRLLSYLLFNPTAQAGITGFILFAIVGIAAVGVAVWVLGMARTKGSKNKKIHSGRLKTSTLTPTERLHLLTNLIIDRIIYDQNNGAALLTKIREVPV